MAGRNQVSTQEMKDIVRKMRNANDKRDTVLKEIQTNVRNTGNCMKSSAGEELRTNMNKMTGKIETYKEIIESYANALHMTAEDYETTEEAVKRNAESLKMV